MATTRIGAGRKPHLYIREHMDDAGATNASIASRLDIHRSTVGKWLAKGNEISVEELTKIAYAMDLDSWEVFLRPPGYESVDALIQDVPAPTREAIVEFAKRLKTGTG